METIASPQITLPQIRLPIGGQANDNGWRERPVVRASRRRKDETYARWENLILPMRFAVRMPGWEDVVAKA